MKKLALRAVAVVAAAVVSSCASTEPPEIRVNASRVEVLDYQGSTFGSPLPKWLSVAANGQGGRELRRALGIGFSRMVFVASKTGPDLAHLENWEDQMGGRSEVAASIEQTIADATLISQNTGVNARGGDDPLSLESTKGHSIRATTITINGLRKEASYWIERGVLKRGIKRAQSMDDYEKRDFQYFVVYSMSKKDYKSLLARASKNMRDYDDQAESMRNAVSGKLLSGGSDGGLIFEKGEKQ